jgi:hypothetical protein
MVLVQTLDDLHDADGFSVELQRYIRETGNKVIVIWGDEAIMSELYLK